MSVPFQHPFQELQFDIFDWHPKFLSCQRHFIEHAQHSGPIQTLAALINIKLPFQRQQSSRQVTDGNPSSPEHQRLISSAVPLVPYIRRLVATGFDSPAVLHGLFGDDWNEGIGAIHETERRNYLFAAKSDNWLRVKAQYDMEDGQTVPFLKPLQNVSVGEIEAAEAGWSEWLAMQDWMLGSRAPESGRAKAD